jgi:Inner membrane protein involved in colicin E2 resistance
MTAMETAAIVPQEEQKNAEMQNEQNFQNKTRMKNEPKPNRSDRLLLKIIIIGLLSLLLLIPQQFIMRLISERYKTSSEAERDVSQLWSKPQRITGPVIRIPAKSSNDNDVYLLPEMLQIKGDVKTETRHRSIFDVTVYTADLDINGNFIMPNLSAFADSVYDIPKAEILIALNDFRGLTENITIKLDDKNYAMKSNKDEEMGSVLCCRIPLSIMQDGQQVNYSVKLPIKGSESLMFLPLGNSTEVQLTSDCTSPSFQGNFLPLTQTVSAQGFTATWKILSINRDFSQMVTRWNESGNGPRCVNMSENEFGVTMKVPVLQYQQTTRSVKYAYLFIFLTFATVFFVEYRRQTPIHPVQYLLIGIALLVFYTLLLSFSEHIPFLWSYLIAMLMTIVLITGYLAGILKIRKTAIMIGLMLLSLYVFMYVLLQLETYTLLVGSIGIFIILAALMYASQKVKWYKES